MKKFIIKETKESFGSIHELRQHALIEQIEDYTLIVKNDKLTNRKRELSEDPKEE